MTVLHLTVTDDDVLAGHVTLTSVTVTTTLDGDTVVTSVEETVLYQYTVATLRVATVSVRTVVDHLHTAYGNVC